MRFRQKFHDEPSPVPTVFTTYAYFPRKYPEQYAHMIIITPKKQPQLPEYFASENLFECGKTPPYVLDPITIEVLEI